MSSGERERAEMFSRVALALDGTSACERVVEVAKVAAKGGHVTVVHVQSGADESEQMRVVDAQIAELNDAGITTELSWTDGLLGGEADEIAAVAKARRRGSDHCRHSWPLSRQGRTAR